MDDSPCKMCGSPVRIQRTRLDRTLDEERGQLVETRVCTSSSCLSSTGQMTLADEV